jgi:hypothetical protein
VLADIIVFGLLIQSVCVVPALETVGTSSTVIATVDELGEQGALEIVQAKIFVPNGKPVIEVVGDKVFVIMPPPEINVHTPVPTPGVFAFIVVVGEEIHIV